MRRLLRLVPPGTVGVGIGLAVVGLASYVHLALAGHNLDAADYSSLSVLWSVVFTLGIGVFFPVEQEVARLVAARRTRGLPPGPVLARGAAVAAAVLGLLLVLTIGLFDGDPAMVPALGAHWPRWRWRTPPVGCSPACAASAGTAPNSASTAGCASAWSPSSPSPA